MKRIWLGIGCAAVIVLPAVWGYRGCGADRLTRQSERNVSSGEPREVILPGKMVYEDGKPAAGLSYGYVSEHYPPIVEPKDFRITGPQGEFSVENPRLDELFSVWAFPRKNTLCVWKRLGPDCQELLFTLKESEYIELPCDWLAAGFTHLAIAQDMVCVPGSKIHFFAAGPERKSCFAEERAYSIDPGIAAREPITPCCSSGFIPGHSLAILNLLSGFFSRIL